jgi:hypothetical protein
MEGRLRKWSRARLGLAACAWFTLAAGARAELITPDSIRRPPPGTLPAVAGAPVAPADVVSSQYAALGLLFPIRQVAPDTAYATVITNVGGTDVWAGAFQFGAGGGPNTVLSFDALSFVAGAFVRPGPLNGPVTTGSFSMELVTSGAAMLSVMGADANGNPTFTSLNVSGPGRTWLTVTAPALEFFGADAFQPVTDPLPGPVAPPLVWGVAAVRFVPDGAQTAPEPSSLALAALGALGLAARAWGRCGRRFRGFPAPPARRRRWAPGRAGGRG